MKLNIRRLAAGACGVGIALLGTPIAAHAAQIGPPPGGSWNAFLPRFDLHPLTDSTDFGILDMTGGESWEPQSTVAVPNPMSGLGGPNTACDEHTVSGGEYWTSGLDYFSGPGCSNLETDYFGGLISGAPNPNLTTASNATLQNILGLVYEGAQEQIPSYWLNSGDWFQVGAGALYDWLEWDMIIPPITDGAPIVSMDGSHFVLPTSSQISTVESDASYVVSEEDQLKSLVKSTSLSANDLAIARWTYWQLASSMMLYHAYLNSSGGADETSVRWSFDGQGFSAPSYFAAACEGEQNILSEADATPNAYGDTPEQQSLYSQWMDGSPCSGALIEDGTQVFPNGNNLP